MGIQWTNEEMRGLPEDDTCWFRIVVRKYQEECSHKPIIYTYKPSHRMIPTTYLKYIENGLHPAKGFQIFWDFLGRYVWFKFIQWLLI